MKLETKWMRFASRMSGGVLLKAFLIYGGYWVGNGLDLWLGSYPVFMLLFICLGTALGFYYLIKLVDQVK